MFLLIYVNHTATEADLKLAERVRREKGRAQFRNGNLWQGEIEPRVTHVKADGYPHIVAAYEAHGAKPWGEPKVAKRRTSKEAE